MEVGRRTCFCPRALPCHCFDEGFPSEANQNESKENAFSECSVKCFTISHYTCFYFRTHEGLCEESVVSSSLIVEPITQLITVSPIDECECHAFLSVCLSVRTCNSKTIAPIDLIILRKKYCTHCSVRRKYEPDLGPDLDS